MSFSLTSKAIVRNVFKVGTQPISKGSRSLSNTSLQRCIKPSVSQTTLYNNATSNMDVTRSYSISYVVSNNDDSGSHSDFAPKRKVVDDDSALKIIDEQVKNHPIMLYMKGNPSMPMCGFSSRVVQVLKSEGVDFSSVNVLDYPAIRDGIKKYSDWPTIPQLYVNGEFIGGCDIVTSMHQSGELAELFKDIPQEK